MDVEGIWHTLENDWECKLFAENEFQLGCCGQKRGGFSCGFCSVKLKSQMRQSVLSQILIHQRKIPQDQGIPQEGIWEVVIECSPSSLPQGEVNVLLATFHSWQVTPTERGNQNVQLLCTWPMFKDIFSKIHNLKDTSGCQMICIHWWTVTDFDHKARPPWNIESFYTS